MTHSLHRRVSCLFVFVVMVEPPDTYIPPRLSIGQQVLSEINRERLISDIKERGEFILCVSSYYSNSALVQGQTYVITEYVITRQIPIAKLLTALNICLVSTRAILDTTILKIDARHQNSEQRA